MDFAFTEEQEALRELAHKIFADHCTHEKLRAVEQTPEWFHRGLWDDLAKANLLGVALPEDVGGSGLGFLELALLLEEQGRAVAPVPLWPTLVLAALPINLFGSEAQRRQWLPGVARGETILTAALVENGYDDAATITATARRDGSTWRLDGAKTRARRPPRGARPRAGAHRRRGGRRVSWSIRMRRACSSSATPRPTASRSSSSSSAAPRWAPTTCSAIRRAAARSSTGRCSAPSRRCARPTSASRRRPCA
jgi:hypothetical protein